MCNASRMAATQYYYTPRCTQNLQCHLPHASSRASCSRVWSPGLMCGFWSGNGHKILCSLMHVTLARRADWSRPLFPSVAAKAVATCNRSTSSVKFLAAYFSGHSPRFSSFLLVFLCPSFVTFFLYSPMRPSPRLICNRPCRMSRRIYKG